MTAKVPTYDELMSRKDKVFITEYGENIYVKLSATWIYENRIWKIDKNTKVVSPMNFVDYLCNIDEKATYLYAVPEWKHNQSPM